MRSTLELKDMEQLKIDNDVINHLSFHKSLIDENDDSSNINFYVEMLEKTNQGEHISIENPFESASRPLARNSSVKSVAFFLKRSGRERSIVSNSVLT